MASSPVHRWWLLLALVFLGTAFGVFLQRFSLTAPLFADMVNVGLDMLNIDLLFVHFGFMFGVRVNLGTLLGGALALWMSR